MQWARTFVGTTAYTSYAYNAANQLCWIDDVRSSNASPDPVQQHGDLLQANRYVYAGGNPINFTDPSGAAIWDAVGDALEEAFKGGRWVVGKAVKINGAVCYIRKSIAAEDRNNLSDDVGDAIECVNPVSGYTDDQEGD